MIKLLLAIKNNGIDIDSIYNNDVLPYESNTNTNNDNMMGSNNI